MSGPGEGSDAAPTPGPHATIPSALLRALPPGDLVEPRPRTLRGRGLGIALHHLREERRGGCAVLEPPPRFAGPEERVRRLVRAREVLRHLAVLEDGLSVALVAEPQLPEPEVGIRRPG